jgi:hypothetical protein
VTLELVLGLPSLLFIVMGLFAGLSAARGFSMAELLAPLAAALCTSVLPLASAVGLWRRARRPQPSA